MGGKYIAPPTPMYGKQASRVTDLAKCVAFRDALEVLFKEFPIDKGDEKRFDRHNVTVYALDGNWDRVIALAAYAGIPKDRVLAIVALLQ